LIADEYTVEKAAKLKAHKYLEDSDKKKFYL
jgi:hypothetical protein